eukprot:m.74040 g.74040  ORF g.74040 m.74040 type:complete len:856 (+) comp12386_c0_seq2:327-2894(+)
MGYGYRPRNKLGGTKQSPAKQGTKASPFQRRTLYTQYGKPKTQTQSALEDRTNSNFGFDYSGETKRVSVKSRTVKRSNVRELATLPAAKASKVQAMAHKQPLRSPSVSSRQATTHATASRSHLPLHSHSRDTAKVHSLDNHRHMKVYSDTISPSSEQRCSKHGKDRRYGEERQHREQEEKEEEADEPEEIEETDDLLAAAAYLFESDEEVEAEKGPEPNPVAKHKTPTNHTDVQGDTRQVQTKKVHSPAQSPQRASQTDKEAEQTSSFDSIGSPDAPSSQSQSPPSKRNTVSLPSRSLRATLTSISPSQRKRPSPAHGPPPLPLSASKNTNTSSRARLIAAAARAAKTSAPKKETAISAPSTSRKLSYTRITSSGLSSFFAAKRSHTARADPTGLRNLGNTCYLNAIIQVLLALPTFTERVYAQRTRATTPVARALLSLIEATRAKESRSSDDVSQIKRAVAKQASQFGGFAQQDAHELFVLLMNVLEMQLKTPSQTFHFETERKRTCLACGVSSDPAYSLESCLCVNVQAHSTQGDLIAMISQYFADEQVSYTCEECGHGQSVIESRLSKLPEVLVVNVKRFYYDAETESMKKNHASVSIPDILDLETFHKEAVAVPMVQIDAGGDGSAAAAADVAILTTYQLNSIVRHVGSGAGAGHYVSDVYDPATERWKTYDDSIVKKVERLNVLGRAERTGYLFFFTNTKFTTRAQAGQSSLSAAVTRAIQEATEQEQEQEQQSSDSFDECDDEGEEGEVNSTTKKQGADEVGIVHEVAGLDELDRIHHSGKVVPADAIQDGDDISFTDDGAGDTTSNGSDGHSKAASSQEYFTLDSDTESQSMAKETGTRSDVAIEVFD